MNAFRVGVTPDFYVDAKGRFEFALEQKLSIPGLEWEPMPAMPGNTATSDAADLYDALFVLGTRFTPDSVRGIERLTLISRWGVGYDKIDVPALTAAGIALAITPNAVRTPVAEAVLTLIMALAKNLRTQDQLTRAGKWRGDLPALGRNVRGQVLGSIGCGNIGSEVFRIVSGLGFSRLLATDPNIGREHATALGVELVELETLLRESDFVTMNTFLNAETRGMINEERLRMMKPTAFFINTSRGGVVDEAALVRALQEGWIAGAGIDVFEPEPPRKDHPLFALDNVIVTPHGLPWTREVTRDNGLEACDNILALARGDVPHGLVNREVLDSPAFQSKLTRYRKEA